MNDNKNIVIVNQDSGYLMIDIANMYHTAGYNVCLITGRLAQRNTELENGVCLDSIIKYNKKTTFFRIFTWVYGTLQIFLKIILKYPNYQILIVSNPPFAPLLALLLKNKVSLLIYDIFPDALIDAGIIKSNSYISKNWKKLNVKAYTKVKRIYTLSESMKSLLCAYTYKDKIDVVPIWSDNDTLKPIDYTDNEFIKLHNLSGKFIVLYSGNLGKTGDVDCIIDFAKNTNDPDIQYIIIGEGVKKTSIEKLIIENKLSNCILLPWQDSKMLTHSLSSASLAIVTLGKKTSKIAMPSKLFSYLAVGVPVLSLSAPDSDLATIVEKHKIGINFDSQNIDEIVKFIVFLKSNKELQTSFCKKSIETSQLFTKKNAELFLN